MALFRLAAPHITGGHHSIGHAHGLLHYLAWASIWHFLFRSGGILLVLAVIVVLWLVVRTRRHHATYRDHRPTA